MDDAVTGGVQVAQVLLSESDGAFASALTAQLEDRGLQAAVAKDGQADVPRDVVALVIADLVPALMVRPTRPSATEEPLPEPALARLEALIAAAGKAGTPRVVLVSAAQVPPGAVPAPVKKAAERLEAALAQACADRAVVLRVAEVMDPAAPGLQQAVRALIDGAGQGWPQSDPVQGIALSDLATVAAAAVEAPGVTGTWFDIVADEAVSRPTLAAEAQRLAQILSDPDLTEVQARPPYPPAVPLRNGSAGAAALRCPSYKSPWVVLAETVQQVVRAASAAGQLPPMVPPMPAMQKALETGALPLAGRQVVLTGATAGIGRAAAQILVRLGADVTGTGRNAEAGAALADELAAQRPTHERLRKLRAGAAQQIGVPAADKAAEDAAPAEVGRFTFERADLADLDQLRALATRLRKQLPRIDILINNAGAVLPERQETPQGIEATLAINLIAPLTLTRLLAGPLQSAGRAGGARVVNVVSDAHFNAPLDLSDLQSQAAYDAVNVYGRAKSGLVMMTQALAEVMDGTGVSIVAVSPGEVRTGLLREQDELPTGGAQARQRQQTVLQQAQMQTLSPEQAAAHVLEVLVSPDFSASHGSYVSGDQIVPPAPHTADRRQTESLWLVLAELGGLEP